MIRYQEGVYKMLGFSVYLGQNLDRDYILNMADLGYDVVFTSLQIPEEDKKNQMAYLGDLCQLLSAYQITYIIDVTPSLLNQTIYSYMNQLPHGDFYIRIDNQLNIDLIKDIISQGFKCCLNASTLTDSMLAHIYRTDFNNQLLYCHNYYPRPDTGLSISFIEEKINSLENTMRMQKFVLLYLARRKEVPYSKVFLQLKNIVLNTLLLLHKTFN